MNCEICGKDPSSYVLLPKRQENGNLNIIACVECSLESGLYCQKHQRPHLGFQDETSACLDCIEDIVLAEGEKIAGKLTGRVSVSLKREEIEFDIMEWADLMMESSRRAGLSDLTLAMKVRQTPHALNVARLIITKAQRMNIGPEDVIEQVTRMGSKVIFS